MGLTDKEAEVLRLVDRTRSTGEIAEHVGRSIHTVEAQIKSARRRLGGLDRYRAADLLRRAEAHQSEVNPGTVMPDDPEPVHQGVVDVLPGGGSVDAGNGDEGIIQSPPAAIRRPRTAVHDRKTDEATPLRTLMIIVVTAAAIALLLLSAPQLAKGAQILAERLLGGSTGATGARNR